MADLTADVTGASLYIWLPATGTRPAPSVATLGTLVVRAVEASDAEAFKVEIQLADGRFVDIDEIRQLHFRFEAEHRMEAAGDTLGAQRQRLLKDWRAKQAAANRAPYGGPLPSSRQDECDRLNQEEIKANATLDAFDEKLRGHSV